MIRYATRADLIRLGTQTVTESLAKVASAKKRTPQNATFLSHSSKDDELMPGVVEILEAHGATVYLDKKDETLLSKNPQQIAQTLRSTIGKCKKFVLFASENTKSSKWVPWELGLGDGYKARENVCIFPGVDKSTDVSWYEQEYMGIYDRLIWGNYSDEKELQWIVWNHETNVGTKLREWLNR